jgi:hypothetical protein
MRRHPGTRVRSPPAPLMKQIPLTQGKVALISTCDYTYLNGWKWYFAKHHANKGGYAVRNGAKGGTIYMHKVIAARQGIEGEVDHRNQNKLDNQRRNLRPATRGQNKANCGRQSNNKSGYTGVGWHRYRGTWQAYIQVKGKSMHLGYYPPTISGKKSAARAYNKAALIHFGDYACFNKV